MLMVESKATVNDITPNQAEKVRRATDFRIGINIQHKIYLEYEYTTDNKIGKSPLLIPSRLQERPTLIKYKYQIRVSALL